MLKLMGKKMFIFYALKFCLSKPMISFKYSYGSMNFFLIFSYQMILIFFKFTENVTHLIQEVS